MEKNSLKIYPGKRLLLHLKSNLTAFFSLLRRLVYFKLDAESPAQIPESIKVDNELFQFGNIILALAPNKRLVSKRVLHLDHAHQVPFQALSLIKYDVAEALTFFLEVVEHAEGEHFSYLFFGVICDSFFQAFEAVFIGLQLYVDLVLGGLLTHGELDLAFPEVGILLKLVVHSEAHCHGIPGRPL